MAFKNNFAQRLFSISRITSPALTNCRISSPCSAAKSAALSSARKLASDPGDDGMFRRYVHRQSGSTAAGVPEVRYLPTGEKLLEKIREIGIAKDRVRLDGLIPPPSSTPPAAGEENLTTMDAKKIIRVSQLEMVKSRLKQLEKDCVSYSEFLGICCKDCSSVDQGLEYAKMLDLSGSVIVLRDIVFLRPEKEKKVVKAIQDLIIQTPTPLSRNDPRTKELQELETHKAAIDKKAEYLVRCELWGGLGYLIVQTAAFMRLTFWELSWDVMEPICFYVTSIYFMGGYTFFLRTSKEPSFEGFFQSRFLTKQKGLIKAQSFDTERYNELKKACYPHSSVARESAVSFTSPVHELALRS